jgi:hypothetical protein
LAHQVEVVEAMARPKSDNPKDRQLLVRLTAGDLHVLEAAAAVRRMTVSGYARDVLARDVDVQRSDPLTVAQLRIFHDFDARTGGAVTAMEGERRRGRDPQSKGAGDRSG